MLRSTSVKRVVGVARQLLMLARLPFRHDRMGLVALTGAVFARAAGPPPSESACCSTTARLVPAGRLERPTFRMSRGRSTVELRWEMVPGQGFKPRFAASEAAVLSLDDPGMLVPPGGYDPPASAFEARRSVRLS
jgi:hypothetical protein